MNTYDRKLAAQRKADELCVFMLEGDHYRPWIETVVRLIRPDMIRYFLAQSRPRNADRPADKRRARKIVKRA